MRGNGAGAYWASGVFDLTVPGANKGLIAGNLFLCAFRIAFCGFCIHKLFAFDSFERVLQWVSFKFEGCLFNAHHAGFLRPAQPRHRPNLTFPLFLPSLIPIWIPIVIIIVGVSENTGKSVWPHACAPRECTADISLCLSCASWRCVCDRLRTEFKVPYVFVPIVR